MENIKRTSIRSKISFHVALLLIGTISFLTFVNLLYMSRNIVKEQEIELHLATELSAQLVDDWAQDMVTVTEDMASSLTALGSIDAETVGSVIDRVALAHPEYYYVYFADKLGNMNMARGVQFAKGVDPRQRPWYKKAEEAGHSVVIDPYTSATSPDVMMVTVATPVFWGSLLVGVVGVDAEISSIEEFTSSISTTAYFSYSTLLSSYISSRLSPSLNTTPRSFIFLSLENNSSLPTLRYTTFPFSERCFIPFSEYTTLPPVAMIELSVSKDNTASSSHLRKPSTPLDSIISYKSASSRF